MSCRVIYAFMLILAAEAYQYAPESTEDHQLALLNWFQRMIEVG